MNYILAKFIFDNKDWPIIWKLIIRMIDRSAIWERSSQQKTTFRAWFTEEELQAFTHALDRAGYEYVHEEGESAQEKEGWM